MDFTRFPAALRPILSGALPAYTADRLSGHTYEEVLAAAAESVVPLPVEWSEILNVPETFPPAAHDHDDAYAPLANGVTNGDGHAHNGGDGAQIAYSSLSGLPMLGLLAAKDSVEISEVTGLGVWHSWTPTFGSGFTLGNGVVSAEYCEFGETVLFHIKVTLGSTSAVTGSIQFTLPRQVSISGISFYGAALDSGSTYYALRGNASSYTVTVRAMRADTTYANAETPTSATVPMTWAVNDNFVFNGSYKKAV